MSIWPRTHLRFISREKKALRNHRNIPRWNVTQLVDWNIDLNPTQLVSIAAKPDCWWRSPTGLWRFFQRFVGNFCWGYGCQREMRWFWYVLMFFELILDRFSASKAKVLKFCFLRFFHQPFWSWREIEIVGTPHNHGNNIGQNAFDPNPLPSTLEMMILQAKRIMIHHGNQRFLPF